MQTKMMERYFFFGLLFCTFVFTFMIFRPFWIVLVLAASLAVVLNPICEWFCREHLPRWMASLVTVIFFVLILCGPLFGIGAIVFNQSQHFYHVITDTSTTGPFLDRLQTDINEILPPGMSLDIHAKVADFATYISGNIAKIFSTTFSALFSFVMMLLAMFYFLKDGAGWKKSLIILSPLSDSDDEKIINRLEKAISGVMGGYLFIAAVQGTMMGIGLALFGVPNPALWGVCAAIASLVPTIGTAFVSVPSILFLYFTGHTSAAVGFAVWAVVLVSTIDNFLSPIFISKKIDMPPLLIMFSVLGGISLLGPVGILMGPLSVSLLYTLISIYRHEYQSRPE